MKKVLAISVIFIIISIVFINVLRSHNSSDKSKFKNKYQTNFNSLNLADYHNQSYDIWYPILFLDSYQIKLNNGNNNVYIYTVLGFDDTGKKKILNYDIKLGKSNSNVWKNLLTNLKTNGITNPILVISCNSNINKEVINNIFPKADIQLVVSQKIKDILLNVKQKDAFLFNANLKNVFSQTNKEYFEKHYQNFRKKWIFKYPEIIDEIEKDLPYLKSYLNYPTMMSTFILNADPMHKIYKKIKGSYIAEKLDLNKLENVTLEIINDFNKNQKPVNIKYWRFINHALRERQIKKYKIAKNL